MKLAVRLLLFAGLLALGYWAWTAAFPNPRKAVLRRLEKLAQLASFPAGEGQLAKLANVQRIGGFFSDQVVVNLGGQEAEARTFNNRDELMQAVQAGRMAFSSVRVQVLNPKVEMTPGNQEAIVGAVLTVDVSGEKDSVVADLKIEMKKIDGDWLITHVETVQ
jgi:SnoaL-like domain